MRKLFKAAAALFALIILIYLGFQVYNAAYPPYKAEVAGMYLVTDSVPFTGIAVRDETVIDNSADGILGYRVNDGDKVATDSLVADIYSSENVARNMAAIRLLNTEYDAVFTASETARFAGANLDSMSGQIYKQMLALSASCYDNNFADFNANRLSAFGALSNFSVAIGNDLDYTAALSEITAQIEGFSAPMYESSGEITTPSGGYFVSYTDGFEGKINKDSLTEMSVSEIASLIDTAGTDINHNSCKVISDYTWYFAAVVDAAFESRFYPEQQLTIDFDYALETDIPVRLTEMKREEGSGKIVLVFACEYLNSDMTQIRIEEGRVSFRNFEGIRVPRGALRVSDGVVGVFTKYDSKVQFKAINIIYEAEDYILAEPSVNPDELNLYDEIITEGKDLNVGKTLN